ncbi:MAG: hypothetical protein MUF81_14225 [Verrucomicrobia bacterium]|jgi:hypothetical protein|nr:hypothetical protein [Verrucomicrobiota bacterium]
MSTFASLVSVHLAGEGKDEISLDTLPGKFTVTRTDEALTPYGGLAAWSGFLKHLGIIERLADQLGSLLGPDSSASGPHPRGPTATVLGTSDDSRVAVGGEAHGIALESVPHGTRSDQLGSLLSPDPSAPRPDPRGSSVTVVAVRSDNGRVAVGGEGHGIALLRVPSHGARPH